MFRCATSNIAVVTIAASKSVTKESVALVQAVGHEHVLVAKPPTHSPALKKFPAVEIHVEKNWRVESTCVLSVATKELAPRYSDLAHLVYGEVVTIHTDSFITLIELHFMVIFSTCMEYVYLLRLCIGVIPI